MGPDYRLASSILTCLTIPMPDDSRIPGRNAEEMPLDGSVLSTVKIGGPILTVDRTIFEMWLGDCKSTEALNPGIVA